MPSWFPVVVLVTFYRSTVSKGLLNAVFKGEIPKNAQPPGDPGGCYVLFGTVVVIALW